MTESDSTERPRPPVTGPTGRTIWRRTKRLVLGLIGSTVLLFGVALLVLPGPGLVVIAASLGILALEFAWARRVLQKGRGMAGKVVGGTKKKDRNTESSPPSH